MHNQVPSDPFQQPATPAAAPPPFPPAPPQPFPPAPGQQPFGGPVAPGQYPPGFGGDPFAPPPKEGTNGWAIAGLLTTFLVSGLVGAIFAVIALRKIKRQPQRGRGLAIATLIIAGLQVLFIAAIFAVIVVDERRDAAAGIDDVVVTDLKAGDCIRDFDGTGAIYDLPTVACTDPHQAEVYHVYTFPEGSYPGTAKVEAESDKRCGAAFEPYLTPQTENMDIYYLYPRDDSEWRQDRSISCVLVAPSATLTAPLTK
ncbi:hypothetical protein FHR83_000483 [Actinoplanes campanulatus]|uniref:Septum formation n=1 Tax=Actinoplanes campanulatus TaxID=113559 RepID=A0A7W5ABP0_9ACTN|nr:DUF4190 domain-containing protein [Actinoplanes campanulatus]MBB3092849.1 hypothetical protein [Actinoplanes campanulatus]